MDSARCCTLSGNTVRGGQGDRRGVADVEYKDYYNVLGVEKTASADDIKKAYRKLVRKYHPDVSKESNADVKTKELNEAYGVLGDPEKRAAYDQLGSGRRGGKG